MEHWHKLENYPWYSVSTEGNVRNDKTNRIIKIMERRKPAAKNDRNGYGFVGLYKEKGGKQRQLVVHRLVAFTFSSPYNGRDQVNHIDGDKLNNRLSNLEWCTQSENMIHARDTGLLK